jgi:hypothetical protein
MSIKNEEFLFIEIDIKKGIETSNKTTKSQ